MSEEQVNDITPTEAVDDKKKKRVKKPKSKARKILEWIGLGFFGLVAGFILAGNISGMINKKENYNQYIRFGVGSFVILSDSMEPRYPVDSAIITYKEDLDKVYEKFNNGETINMTFFNCADEKFDIYGFRPDNSEYTDLVVKNMVMTHEIKEIHKNEQAGGYVFVAAGINPKSNTGQVNQYQVFTSRQYLGVVKHCSTFLGKIFHFLVSPIGLIVLLLIPAAYLIITSSIDIFRVLKESEENEGISVKNGGSAALSSLSEAEKEKLKKELLNEMLNKKKGENDGDK